MNLKELRLAALARAQAIIDGAKDRDLTAEETSTIEGHLAEVKSYDEKIKSALESQRLAKQVGDLAMASDNEPPRGGGHGEGAKSLGEHFVKSIGAEGLANLKSRGGFTVSAPEYKANTDPQLVPTSLAPVLTEIDRTIVRAFRRPTVSDLLSAGSLSGNAVTYFVEGSFEGSFATVAENGQKPQIHVADPTAVTDSLKKIAAWWDTSDEMADDLDFWVSEVNNRALYMLGLTEEDQLLNGLGTGSTVLGLLKRVGVQTETQGAAPDSAQDALFRAMTKVQTATGLSADGIVINPADYQALRLSKDANGQYFGGGFFSGEYGNGGVPMQPPLWGLNTIVSAAVPAKTAVVGAFKAAATVYRKGGVRVESTNSDLGKFTKNVITTRIEERVALAVRIPSAVVKVTLL